MSQRSEQIARYQIGDIEARTIEHPDGWYNRPENYSVVLREGKKEIWSDEHRSFQSTQSFLEGITLAYFGIENLRSKGIWESNVGWIEKFRVADKEKGLGFEFMQNIKLFDKDEIVSLLDD